MALLKIARMGHPVLARAAERVGNPRDPALARLAMDMIETMRDAPGIGLAAPQVHAGVRIVVFHVPPSRADDPEAPNGAAKGPVPLTVLINPQIEWLDDSVTEDWEGCLSVPGLTGLVPRARRIRYRGIAPDGGSIERVAEGFHARVVQHECDHLDGVLYPQRMTDLRQFGFVEEIGRAQATANRPAGRREAV